MNLGRIFILTLVGVSAFLAGTLYENTMELNLDLWFSPLAICLSTLFATCVALTNLNQNAHNELVKRTLDVLDKKPIFTLEQTYFRNRINHRIHSMELYKKPITKDVLEPVIRSMKTGECNIARVWLSYVSHMYIGIQEGIYDKAIIEKNIGNLPVNVWRDFWPVAKWQELKLEQANGGIDKVNGTEYEAVEEWVKEIRKGEDLTRVKPELCYYPTDEDSLYRPDNH